MLHLDERIPPQHEDYREIFKIPPIIWEKEYMANPVQGTIDDIKNYKIKIDFDKETLKKLYKEFDSFTYEKNKIRTRSYRNWK